MTTKKTSQFRQDLVSGGWVLVATSRSKRPHAFRKKEKRPEDPIKTCPFEDPQASGNAAPLLQHPSPPSSPWRIQVIPNKFQYFNAPKEGRCPMPYQVGHGAVMDGDGFNEIVITRDHSRQFSDLTLDELVDVIRVYQERYLALETTACVKYISVFHNYGAEAGASLTHPHSQILALPVIPPDVRKSLEGSRRYFAEHQKCVHCVLVQWEEREGKRVVYENDIYLVVAPFASRMPFEITITPKIHQSNFENIQDRERALFADAMGAILKKLKEGLGDPAYNFYIHTAPATDGDYAHYHWHMDIVPKTAIWAGFELATGIEISTIAPEEAAAFLRNVPPVSK